LPVGGAFGPDGGPGGGFSADVRATIQAGGEIPPELQATFEARRAQGGDGQGFGPRGTISPELRATIEAGGGPPGFGLRGTISPDQRATIEAGGGPGGFGFRGGGENVALLNRLVETLTTRASSGATPTP
jgi:hypothetical protein